jgi:Uncharacterized protein conserved in bacteria
MPAHHALPACLLVLLAAAGANATERVLVFSATAGFRHDSIPTAVKTVQELAAGLHLGADHSEDRRTSATPTWRATARWCSPAPPATCSTGHSRPRCSASCAPVAASSAVHAASDTEHDWPWYGELAGAWFGDHPPGLQATTVQPERGGAALGAAWAIEDEIYNFRRNPRGQVQVLATVDESLYAGGRMGEDHPIAWCRAFEGGRSWYTGLGHAPAVYARPEFRSQLRQGLRYVTGLSPDC